MWETPHLLRGSPHHVSVEERSTLEAMLTSAGLVDLVRPQLPEGYTYWDYTQGKLRKNHGMRIDFLFGNKSLSEQVNEVSIEREQRTGEQPSDHVPVVVEMAEEADDFDSPMVF
jgi:Exonuclease III